MNAPVYVKLRDDLKELIKDRKMLPGTPLPSENDLSKKYRISRSSVRLALQELENEKLISKLQGKGSVVNDYTLDITSQQRKRIIGLDLTDSDIASGGTSWYYGDILKGIQEAASETKSRIQLVSEADFATTDSIDIDGLIITRPENWPIEKLAMFTARNRSVVIINKLMNDPELNYVAVDSATETYKAVEYLIRLGHEKIAFAGSSTGEAMQHRKKGYLSALKTYDIPIRNEFIFTEDFSPLINEKMENFLKTAMPTALIAANGSYCTFSVLPVIIKMGLKMPEDLSLICFDDIEVNNIQHDVPVSCIKMPLKAMGKAALNHIVNPCSDKLRQIFSAELIIRKSCIALNHKTPIPVE